jgi:glycosyltransferase involved in cell wall biosynthesis
MVKDEIDIVPASIPYMMEQLDRVVVYDNGSTDGTREYLESLTGDGLIVKADRDPGYWQGRKMTRWAAEWADTTSWLIPFDADELWHCADEGSIAENITRINSGVICPAPTYDYVPTVEDDPLIENPIERMEYRKAEPAGLPKIACRPSLPVWIQQGNHGASYPSPQEVHGLLVITHYQYRSEDQFVKKIRNGYAAYKKTTLPEALGAHWRAYGRLLEEEGEEGLKEAYRLKLVVDDVSSAKYVKDPLTAHA